VTIDAVVTWSDMLPLSAAHAICRQLAALGFACVPIRDPSRPVPAKKGLATTAAARGAATATTVAADSYLAGLATAIRCIALASVLVVCLPDVDDPSAAAEHRPAAPQRTSGSQGSEATAADVDAHVLRNATARLGSDCVSHVLAADGRTVPILPLLVPCSTGDAQAQRRAVGATGMLPGPANLGSTTIAADAHAAVLALMLDPVAVADGDDTALRSAMDLRVAVPSRPASAAVLVPEGAGVAATDGARDRDRAAASPPVRKLPHGFAAGACPVTYWRGLQAATAAAAGIADPQAPLGRPDDEPRPTPRTALDSARERRNAPRDDDDDDDGDDDDHVSAGGKKKKKSKACAIL
jgi:hypothetical protein